MVLFKKDNKTNLKSHKEQILKQRKTISKVIKRTKHIEKEVKDEWIKTGIGGFDNLFEKGIPKGISILICGGPGVGKTLFCLNLLNNAASNGKKCLFISLEESADKLKKHMKDFGWNPDKLEKDNLLIIKRVEPFAIVRSIEALVAKEEGQLKMDFEGVQELIPKNFNPDFVVIDSLTDLEAFFKKENEDCRIYVERLFRYFENLNVNSFLISEIERVPTRFNEAGDEEFLADGVIILYDIMKDNERKRALEILKMRGAKFKQKIFSMEIGDKGIKVFPSEEFLVDERITK